jgi:hypothetical protein
MKISSAVPEGRHDETEADFQIICWSFAKNDILVA